MASDSSDSERGSEVDPYEGTHTDTDEDYLPSNERGNLTIQPVMNPSSDEDDPADVVGNEQPTASNTPQIGKKKRVRKELWKRTIQKTKRVKGEPYINVAGVHKPGHQIGDNCHCKSRCLDGIGHGGCTDIFQNFYGMPSKDLQDAYLYGLIKMNPVQRPRPRSGDGPTRNSSFVYKVRHRGEELKICKKAFLALHGITKSRLERLQKHLTLGNGTPPVDKRGKHVSRPNQLSEATNEKIRQHILSYPRYKSHYSRKDNVRHYYLSPLLNIAKMHGMYLQKNEPEQYQLLLQNQNINPVVKYEYFRKFFTENFKISFGKPKSDTCQKCDKLMNKIDAADTEEQRNELETEKKVHITKAETFYTDINNKTALAKSDISVEVLTFDYQQNLPLPVSSSGEVFYKIQLWVYNFCIHVGSTGKSFFYLYDETLAAKGQNDVASLLFHFLNNHIRPEVTDVHIFSDNCASQNKNYVLTQFLYTMVATNRFKVIQHRYPEPGHSFLPCDRSFGIIEQEKRKYDKIYLPKDYRKIIETTSKNFKVITATQDMFLDFKTHLQQFFVKTPSRKNKKFTISKYRVMRYEKQDTKVLFTCSESVALTIFTDFDIEDKRKSENVSLPSNENKLYSERRKLKQNKFEHVMTLAKEYVPGCDFWFYEDIEKYHKSFLPDSNETSMSEFSDE